MARRAFAKIKAGLDDACAWLDGSADPQRGFRVHHQLPAIHPGEVLAAEFMKPNDGLSRPHPEERAEGARLEGWGRPRPSRRGPTGRSSG